MQLETVVPVNNSQPDRRAHCAAFFENGTDHIIKVRIRTRKEDFRVEGVKAKELLLDNLEQLDVLGRRTAQMNSDNVEFVGEHGASHGQGGSKPLFPGRS